MNAQPMASNVSSFLIDGQGNAWAFEPTGSSGGTLVRFAAGSSEPETIPGSFLYIAKDGSGDIVAQGTSNPTTAITSSTSINVTTAITTYTFTVPSGLMLFAGDVVSCQGTGSYLGLGGLVYSGPCTLAGTVTSYSGTRLVISAPSISGSGTVSNWTIYNESSNLWLFAAGATSGQILASNVSNFLVDANGSVWAFQPTIDLSAGTLLQFTGGASTQIQGSFTQIELDGSGSLIALTSSGNLERFQPGWTTPQPMASDVSSFVIDGAGFVVADVLFSVGNESIHYLIQFSPGSDLGTPLQGLFTEDALISDVTTIALDGTGAVIALDTSGELVRYAPGSLQGQLLDTNFVASFKIDGSGQVVALESGGSLVRFVPVVTSDSFVRQVMIAATNFSTCNSGTVVQSFHIDQNGYVIAAVEHVSGTYGNLNPIGITPDQLVYFLPSQSTPNYYSFPLHFPDFSDYWVLANGEMLVTIASPTLPGDGGLCVIQPGSYAAASYYQFDVLTVTVNSNDTQWSYTAPAQSTGGSPILGIFLDLVGVFATIVSAGALAPALAGVAVTEGVGEGLATIIGSVVAVEAANAVTQGIDIAVTGHGSFNWTQFLTAGFTAATGGDLVGDLGDVVDGLDDTVVGNALDDSVTQAVGSFATNLLKGGSISSALGQAAEGGLDSLVDDVGDALENSGIGSTFLQDASSFLNQVSDVTADLPFANSALSFLGDAASGNWSGDSLFASFADSGAFIPATAGFRQP